MESKLLKTIATAALVLTMAGSVFAQGLTSEQALRAKVQTLEEKLFQATLTIAQLNATLSDTKAQLDGFTLTAQAAGLRAKHAALESELKKALGGSDEDTLDWTTDPPTLKPQAKD